MRADFVTVRFPSETKARLYIAPSLSGLKQGDIVRAETNLAENVYREGTVQHVLEYVELDSELAEFLRSVTGEKNFRKILSTVVEARFDYGVSD